MDPWFYMKKNLFSPLCGPMLHKKQYHSSHLPPHGAGPKPPLFTRSEASEGCPTNPLVEHLCCKPNLKIKRKKVLDEKRSKKRPNFSF